MRFLLVAAPALLLAGCPGSSGPECSAGVTCLDGEVCANTHECVPSDQVQRVGVHWTIAGQAPTATLCSAHPDLDLTISSLTTGGELTYSPIVCANGLFTFDKLPVIYDGVSLDEPTSGATASTSIPAGGGDVTIDLPQ